MPRRRVVAKREILPDPKFNNVTLAKFMNHVMVSGKKSVAERIVYGALDIVTEKADKDALEIFGEALEKAVQLRRKKTFIVWLKPTKRSLTSVSKDSVRSYIHVTLIHADDALETAFAPRAH